MNQHNDIPELSALGPDCHAEWTDLYHADHLCESCRITFAQIAEPAGWVEDPVELSFIPPSVDEIKMLWSDEKGPTIRDIRGAAYRGCHFCTLVISQLLFKRRNLRLHDPMYQHDKVHENDRVHLKAAKNRRQDRLTLYGGIRFWIADGDRCDPALKTGSERRRLKSRLNRRETDYGWSSLTREYCYVLELTRISFDCTKATNPPSAIPSPSLEAPASPLLADQQLDDPDLRRELPSREICETKGNNHMPSPKTKAQQKALNLDLGMSAEVIAGQWLKDCLQNHDCGHHDTADPILPLRVIDIQGRNGSGVPFLVQTHGQHAKYTTLSYRWGNGRQLKTTTDTIKERHHSIPMDQMPKTFRDAVNLTHQLGVQYLWIDSLCILQDSEEDCLSELASMADIYSNSTLTIAAVGSLHADDGCAPDRNKLAMCHCSVGDYIISFGFGSHHETLLQEGSIHRRAWCFQETEISPRLLSVGLSQLYWQCKRGLRRESEPNAMVDAYSHGFHSIETYGDTSIIQDWPIRNRFFDGQLLLDPLQAYSRWYWLLEQYVGRDLTFPNDMLPAISALAVKFLDMFECFEDRPRPEDYCCGLWRQDLLPGLLWYDLTRKEGRPPGPFRAPSWSWAASYRGYLAFPFSNYPRRQYCFHTTVLDISIEQVSQIGIFGGVRSGKLTVYGPVAPLPESCYVLEEESEQSFSVYSDDEHGDFLPEEVLDRYPVSESPQDGDCSRAASTANEKDLIDLGPELAQDGDGSKSPKLDQGKTDTTRGNIELPLNYKTFRRHSDLSRPGSYNEVNSQDIWSSFREGWTLHWDHDDSPIIDCHLLRITDEDFLVLRPVRKPGTVGTAKGCKGGIYQRVGVLKVRLWFSGPPKKTKEEDLEEWERYERETEMLNTLYWKEELLTII